eukprot:COSAG06_NODE_17041_length_965_cov_1.247113_1_plen_128_part_00
MAESPKQLLPCVAEIVLLYITSLIISIPAGLSEMGDRFVNGKNALWTNNREFLENPTIVQHIQIVLEQLDDMCNGNGIGFFLIRETSGNMSLKITQAMAQRNLITGFTTLAGVFSQYPEIVTWLAGM